MLTSSDTHLRVSLYARYGIAIVMHMYLDVDSTIVAKLVKWFGSNYTRQDGWTFYERREILYSLRANDASPGSRIISDSDSPLFCRSLQKGIEQTIRGELEHLISRTPNDFQPQRLNRNRKFIQLSRALKLAVIL